MTIEQEINQIIHAFHDRIAELARRAAIDTLGAAFGGHGAPGRASLTPPGRRPRRGGGQKRAPSELSELSDRFATFVRHNPGLRIEQINKQLGTTTKDLALPIRKLVVAGVVRTKNKKRSTTYFLGTSSKPARA
jgi:hypothetical protein